ncbi:MAG: hypothetical protein ACLUD2_16650 [Clostridium sp.]
MCCSHRYNMIQMSKAVVMQAASVAMLETFCDEQNREAEGRISKKEAGIFRPSGSVPAMGISHWSASGRSHRRWSWINGLA